MSTTSHPNFFRPLSHVIRLIRLLIGRELEHLQSHRLNKRPCLWSSFVTLLQTNKTKRRLLCLSTTTVLRAVLIVALGVHVIVVLI